MSSRFLPSKRTSPSVTVKASRPARTPASVLLPEPLGPMMACTSPALTLRLTPRRISLSSTRACRLKMVSIGLLRFPLLGATDVDDCHEAIVNADLAQGHQWVAPNEITIINRSDLA